MKTEMKQKERNGIESETGTKRNENEMKTRTKRKRNKLETKTRYETMDNENELWEMFEESSTSYSKIYENLVKMEQQTHTNR